MDGTDAGIAKQSRETVWGKLPPRLKVLFVAVDGATCWLDRALEKDPICCVETVQVDEPTHALEQLRATTFDAVLIEWQPQESRTLTLIDAIRTQTGPYQPILVLDPAQVPGNSLRCFQAGADAYLDLATTTPQDLVWQVARAAERHQLITQNERYRSDLLRRRRREQDEVLKVLAEQRAVVAAAHPGSSSPTMPGWLLTHLGELLQAYVIMGSGNLTEELQRLVERLDQARIPARSVMLGYLQAMDDMIARLGPRSAQHVLHRGNVLLIDLVLKLSDRQHHRSEAA